MKLDDVTQYERGEKCNVFEDGNNRKERDE